MLAACLIAAFAIGAVVASGASALPEWGKCEAKAGGKYSDSSCQTKAKKGTGTYEYLKATQVKSKRISEGKSGNVPFSGSSEGSGGVLTTNLRGCETESGQLIQTTRAKCAEEGGTEFEVEEPIKIECEGETNSGEAESKNRVTNIQVTFTGCALGAFLPCQSEGAAEGEVKTKTLKGFLGYISKTEKEVGLVLEPASKHGAFAEFECGGVNETVVGVGDKKTGTYWEDKPGVEKHGGYDQVISPITPVNTMTSTFTQVFSVSSEPPFNNIPHALQGKHISALEDWQEAVIEEARTQWESAGEEITNVNTPEEEGMIKA
jgi:hypothetical protein